MYKSQGPFLGTYACWPINILKKWSLEVVFVVRKVPQGPSRWTHFKKYAYWPLSVVRQNITWWSLKVVPIEVVL